MNTKALNSLAATICAAQATNRTPMGIALAIDSAGQHLTPELVAEVERLRLLQNAQPAALSEVQLEALIDAGNRARNDYYHERACSCSEWPTGCATDPDYANGYWDSDTFAVAAAAVIGAWESMRAPAEADELARPRAERSPVLETEQAALLAELIGDVQPARVSLLLALGESVRDRRDHDHTTQNEDWFCTNLAAYMGERMAPVLRRLLNSEAEQARLRARVAELEAERKRGGCEQCGASPEEWCERCASCPQGCFGGSPKSEPCLIQPASEFNYGPEPLEYRLG
ncbi:hypothetical protein [Streptomyces xanthophaeus]|uniref:hypothetical protein n=1 Tax=Streptomyces xanthophaeus TaxID=67385 RepID=UPI00365C2480